MFQRSLRLARKRWIRATLAAGVVFTSAAVAAFWLAPALLIVDSGECRADAIVVLGGEPYGRPLRAAELFNAGAAPVIIASGDGDCQEVVRALKANGVPESAIRTECESGNTKENAEFTVRMLKNKTGDYRIPGPQDDRTSKLQNSSSNTLSLSSTHPPINQQPVTINQLNNSRPSVIIVTSWFHSRRALRCFEKAAPGIRFYSRPSYYGLARSDWRRTGMSSWIVAEYVKIAGYAVVYGICPW